MQDYQAVIVCSLQPAGPACITSYCKTIVTDVPSSAWLFVCLSVSHNHELCQNGRTNRDVVRAVVSGAPKESCTGLGAQIPPS